MSPEQVARSAGSGLPGGAGRNSIMDVSRTEPSAAEKPNLATDQVLAAVLPAAVEEEQAPLPSRLMTVPEQLGAAADAAPPKPEETAINEKPEGGTVEPWRYAL